MKLVFSDQYLPDSVTKSIFLAGPSPRDNTVLDWRVAACQYLKNSGFEGTVFIPTPEARFSGENDDHEGWSYDGQISWECKARHMADQIVFWVPRSIEGKMSGFTTNVEFGEDINSGKIVYGRPPEAEKCRYLDIRITDLGLTVFETIEQTLNEACRLLDKGALRVGGEVNVPLFIWITPQFQSWYKNLKQAGNRLDDAQLLHHFKISGGRVLSFNLWVSVWIEKEQRLKSNEFIVSRTDISTIVAFHTNTEGTHVVMVKEFRSPVNNLSGYVLELPGGSATAEGVDPLVNAQHELKEETGIFIEDASRFCHVGERQLVATLSTHRAHLYSVELTALEFENAISSDVTGSVFGVISDSELTHVSIINVDHMADFDVDFSMMGMVMMALKA